MEDRIKPNKPKGYWTKERCQEESLKYNTRNEFKKGSYASYQASTRNKWIGGICSHMKNKRCRPCGYWTKERCHEEAQKHKTISNFNKCEPGAYERARKEGWLYDICSQRGWKHSNPKGYWTKERCHEEAQKHKTKTEFKKGSSSAYTLSHRKGWLDEICPHMTEIKKTSWSYDGCKQEALKYNSKVSFQKGSNGAYKKALKNDWLDEVCSHMTRPQSHNFYWTKERCQEESLKYKTRTKFQKSSCSAYGSAFKNDWLDEVCSHMTIQGSLKKRYIYSFEFTRYKSVYVGLTWKHEERFWSHLNKGGAVYDFIQENNLTENDFTFKIHGYYEMLQSQSKEGELLSDYESKGWDILNKAKTGGLGGFKLKWTKKRCQKEALKYISKSEFYKGSPSAYERTRKEGWLDEMCSHMISTKELLTKWTKEKCVDEALKYKHRTEFYKGSSGAYGSALKNDWLDEVCSHMEKKPNREVYWTFERCKEEVLKYSTKRDLKNGSRGAHERIYKQKWVDELCSHMVEPPRKKIVSKYTKQMCKVMAKTVKNRTQFQNKYSGAYKTMYREGWLDEFFPK